ncbi:hypothetical protein SB912_32310, partial [Pantoea sp. SIMBA_072]
QRPLARLEVQEVVSKREIQELTLPTTKTIGWVELRKIFDDHLVSLVWNTRSVFDQEGWSIVRYLISNPRDLSLSTRKRLDPL